MHRDGLSFPIGCHAWRRHTNHLLVSVDQAHLFIYAIYIIFSSTNDDKLIQIGKDVCNSSDFWTDEEISIDVIYKLLKEYNFEIETDNRIIPILRFQSTYELCPENISTLEKLFQNEK